MEESSFLWFGAHELKTTMVVMLRYTEPLCRGSVRGVNDKRISARFGRMPERLRRMIQDLLLLCELESR